MLGEAGKVGHCLLAVTGAVGAHSLVRGLGSQGDGLHGGGGLQGDSLDSGGLDDLVRGSGDAGGVSGNVSVAQSIAAGQTGADARVARVEAASSEEEGNARGASGVAATVAAAAEAAKFGHRGRVSGLVAAAGVAVVGHCSAGHHEEAQNEELKFRVNKNSCHLSASG